MGSAAEKILMAVNPWMDVLLKRNAAKKGPSPAPGEKNFKGIFI